MVAKNSKLFTILFLAGVSQFCTGEQATDSITAYQCRNDFTETASPSAISPTDRVLRVCIAGVSSAVDCRKIVEATVTQESNSIKQRLVISGQQQVAFAHATEIRTEKKKCMVSVLLANNCFIKSASTKSLQVVISGSVSAAVASSNTTIASSNATAASSRAEPAEETEVPFSLSVSLTPSDTNPEPIKDHKLDAVPNSVAAYQCTSDYVEVIDPPAISREGRMLRVCIAGVASETDCLKVLEATLTQASKQISDRLVVSGQNQERSKDNIEVTTQGGKCMIAAYLTEKYFIESSSQSLQVKMSGVVSVTPTSERRHLRAEPAEEGGSKVPFEIPVSLTITGDTEEYERLPTMHTQIEDGAAGVYGIAVGVAAVVMMLI